MQIAVVVTDGDERKWYGGGDVDVETAIRSPSSD